MIPLDIKFFHTRVREGGSLTSQDRKRKRERLGPIIIMEH